MNPILDSIISILNVVLFDNGEMLRLEDCDDSVLSELERHAILPLTLPVLKRSTLTPEQKRKWTEHIYRCIFRNRQVIYNESAIIKLLQSHQIPLVILKGSSFAQYYPIPPLRARGDIDILLDKDSIDVAIHILTQDGFSIASSGKRHIEMIKGNVEVELHRFFSIADPNSAYFCVEKADSNCFFPNVENGLSMLLHIKFHLDEIGLRHYLDWVLFVKNVCSDSFWNDNMVEKARKFEVFELACALTKKAKELFPLDNISWCDEVSPLLVEDVWQSIIEAGNFQSGNTTRKLLTITSKETGLSTILRLLKDEAVRHNESVKRHPILMPIVILSLLWKYLCKVIKTCRGNIIILLRKIARNSRLKKHKVKFNMDELQ